MASYIPIHKRTGERYPVITDAERELKWSREPYRSHFTFEPVADARPEKVAAEPTEAKKVKSGTDQPTDPKE